LAILPKRNARPARIFSGVTLSAGAAPGTGLSESLFGQYAEAVQLLFSVFYNAFRGIMVYNNNETSLYCLLETV
jgi:hypothetical protein